MLVTLIQLIDFLAQAFILLVVIDSILSFFLSPYHPVREALGRIINPLLEPIRRVVPPMGGLDLSPMVLIFIIIILEGILRQILVIF